MSLGNLFLLAVVIASSQSNAYFERHETLEMDSVVSALRFSPNGKLLAIESANDSDATRTRLWDIQKKAFVPAGRETTPVGTISWLSRFNSVSRQLDKKTALRALRSVRDRLPPNINCAITSPDGRLVAIGVHGTDDGTLPVPIELWDVRTQRIKRRIQERGSIFGLAFSPDRRLLASVGSEWAVRIWNVSTGRRVALLAGHREPLYAVAFSPNGTLLAAGGKDRRASLWALK